MEKIFRKYPFDCLDKKTKKGNIGPIHISKKLAKALIVKFLKREHAFDEMMTECMLYDKKLKSVNDVLNNMVRGEVLLSDCLYNADRTFAWSEAQVYHKDGYGIFWSDLHIRWVRAIGAYYLKDVIVDRR